MCWFEAGRHALERPAEPLAGLGLLEGSLTVHADGEPERLPVWLAHVRDGGAARRLGARRRRRPALPRPAHGARRELAAGRRARSASTRSPASSCGDASSPRCSARHDRRRLVADRRGRRGAAPGAPHAPAHSGGAGDERARAARGRALGRATARVGHPPISAAPRYRLARRAADASVSRENVDHDHARDGCTMQQRLKIKQTSTGYWTVQRGDVHLRGAMTRRAPKPSASCSSACGGAARAAPARRQPRGPRSSSRTARPRLRRGDLIR